MTKLFKCKALETVFIQVIWPLQKELELLNCFCLLVITFVFLTGVHGWTRSRIEPIKRRECSSQAGPGNISYTIISYIWNWCSFNLTKVLPLLSLTGDRPISRWKENNRYLIFITITVFYCFAWNFWILFICLLILNFFFLVGGGGGVGAVFWGIKTENIYQGPKH